MLEIACGKSFNKGWEGWTEEESKKTGRERTEKDWEGFRCSHRGNRCTVIVVENVLVTMVWFKQGKDHKRQCCWEYPNDGRHSLL